MRSSSWGIRTAKVTRRKLIVVYSRRRSRGFDIAELDRRLERLCARFGR